MINPINNTQTNPTFGMALFLPPEQNLSILGEEAVSAVKKAKPKLKNYDVFVKEDKNSFKPFDSINISVHKPDSVPQGTYVYETPVSASVRVNEFAGAPETLAKVLVDKTKKLKEFFVKGNGISTEEMIHPGFIAGIYTEMFRYLALNKCGKVEDLDKNLARFTIREKPSDIPFTLGYVTQLVGPSKEPAKYVITGRFLDDIDGSNIIHPKHLEQFKKETESFLARYRSN